MIFTLSTLYLNDSHFHSDWPSIYFSLGGLRVKRTKFPFTHVASSAGEEEGHKAFELYVVTFMRNCE